jgi:glutamyl-tRNA reductase
MHSISGTTFPDFYVAGISYKKIEAETRGQFAISNDQYQSLLNKAEAFGIRECFVLSTCNRTEIYGLADDVHRLINLLCTQTAGRVEDFINASYIKKGEAAIQHLFEVGAGLDSQILGDYEIIGQIKSAVKLSKERGFVGPYLERLVNAVLQSSKAIKNQTSLSGGTVSVSFAAVQFIREQVQDISTKKILLIGTGKIGRSTCKNLVDYLESADITLINRTPEKAIELANELGVSYAPDEQMSEMVQQADIILVATNADEPIILVSDLENTRPKLIIDLSVPCNVEQAGGQLKNIQLVNVDELSKMKDETLARRQAEVPKAREILKIYIGEFLEWCEMRKHVPVLKAIKTKLKEMHSCRLYLQQHSFTNVNSAYGEERIQRVINGMASKLRARNQRGCHYIEAINDYLATGSD